MNIAGNNPGSAEKIPQIPETQNNPDSFFQGMVDSFLLKIANGELKAGDAIPSPVALASDFGTSSGSIIRVFEHLNGLGVLNQFPGKPTVVAEGAQDKAFHSLSQRYVGAIRMNAARLIQLPQGRDVLESLMAELNQPTQK